MIGRYGLPSNGSDRVFAQLGPTAAVVRVLNGKVTIAASGCIGGQMISLHLDVGRPDHFAPHLGFVDDEPAEVGR